MIDRAIFHRAPLAPDAFAPLPTGAIKPLGYLLAAERAQANGLGGQSPAFGTACATAPGWAARAKTGSAAPTIWTG